MKRLSYCALAAAILLTSVLFLRNNPAEAHTRFSTELSWSENIREIFAENCMSCHHPGGIAPDMVDLTFWGTDTEPGAWAWRSAVEQEIIEGRMPPWKPDPRFGSFSNSRELTDLDRDTIIAWIRGNGPNGPIRNLPTPDQFLRPDWSYGQPDLVYSLPKGHVVPADQQFDMAEAMLDVEIEEDTFVTGYEFLAENPKNIFRISAYIHDPKGVDLPPLEVEVQKEFDPLADEDDLVEIRLRPTPEGPHFLGQWVHGDGPVLFPDGAGRLLRKGSKIHLKIEFERPAYAENYYEDISDSSKLGLFIAQPDEDVDLLVETMTLKNDDFVVKANDANMEVRAELTIDESSHLIGVNPILGALAKDLRINAIYPDGFTKTLMWIPEYKKQWTASYQFAEPIDAPLGTRIEMIAHYDNTEDNWDNPNDPPIDVAAGDGFTDERLLALLDYTPNDHLKLEEIFVPRERPESEQGGGMTGLAPGVGDAPDRPVFPGLPEEAEEGPIKQAKNGYHQVEALMEEPGEIEFYVYDNTLNPIDPRNFRGEITLENGTTVPLVHHNGLDDHFKAWINPTDFPVSFQAKLLLSGQEETFDFTLDGLADSDVEAESYKPEYDGPHGGWLADVDDGFMRIEATLEEPGKLRIYPLTHDLSPVEPRLFTKGHVLEIDGGATGKPIALKYSQERVEYLEARISEELPVAVSITMPFGRENRTFEFQFDELTEEPWDDWGQEKVARQPLIVGPHGSTQFFKSSTGIHLVEGAMPRPGALRVYLYNEWKDPLDPRLFDGVVIQNGREVPLTLYQPGDAYLTAFVGTELPAAIEAKLWINGRQETFTFTFEAPTIDPTEPTEPSAHMDHAPMHGGELFMADNEYHHVEGAIQRPREFRAYFYDNYKQPIDPRSFSGQVFILRGIDEETGEAIYDPFDLFFGRPGDEHLTAVIEADLPVIMHAIVSLGGEDKRYDFEFETLSVEPPKSFTTAAAQGATSGEGHTSHFRPPLNVPETVEGILAEIFLREEDLNARIQSQDWYTLFIPAFDARDLIAALAEKEAGFSVRQVGQLKLLRGAINRSVNDIETTAHSADPPRIQQSYKKFAKGLDELRDLYDKFIQ